MATLWPSDAGSEVGGRYAAKVQGLSLVGALIA
jgi:hypothetical protein